MRNFALVPRSLILDKELGDKRVIAYVAAVFKESSRIESLVSFSGYYADNKHGRIVTQFKELIESFIDKGYFQEDGGKLIQNVPQCQFGKIYRSEWELITRQENSRRSARQILVLAYIRSSYIRRNGYCDFYSDLFIRMSEIIGIPPKAISSAAKQLEEFNIIHSEELSRYKSRDGKWHSNVRLFIDISSDGGEHLNDWCKAASLIIGMIISSQLE